MICTRPSARHLMGALFPSMNDVQYDNWKSVWMSFERFGKALFELSYVSAAHFMYFH